MVRKFLSVFVIGGALALAGCNTVKGVGEDVESVGQAGDRAT